MRGHFLQLQDRRMGLLEVLLKLQSQIVDSNAGDWWHVALGRLCRTHRGGAVQNKPHHDDSEGQDVESRKLGGENNCGLHISVPAFCQLCFYSYLLITFFLKVA